MRLLRYSILLVAALPVILSAQNHTPLKLWYDKPAANWNEALPIGNGRLAAMLFGDPENERIVLFPFSAVYGERTAVPGQVDRRTAGLKGQCFMDLRGKTDGFVGSVSQSKRSKHVTFRSDSYAGAAALDAFLADILPEVSLNVLDVFLLRICFDLFKNPVYFFQLEIDYIIHDPLGFLHMLNKETGIKTGFLGKRLVDITVQVDGQKTATVVCTEGYLSAGIGRYGPEAKIGVAIGN